MHVICYLVQWNKLTHKVFFIWDSYHGTILDNIVAIKLFIRFEI